MNIGVIILILVLLALLRWFRKAGVVGKIFIGLSIALFIGTGLLAFLSVVSNNFDETSPETTDAETKVEQLQDRRGNVILSSLRQWNDYNDEAYTGRINVDKKDYDQARRFRNSVADRLTDTEQSWHTMYAQLAQNDAPKLDMLCNMLDSIRQANQLNTRQFAELITTCIQDIPYYLILEGPCDPRYYEGEFIQEYLKKGEPCMGNVAFGLQSPAEFMGNLKGDCDTRTVLAYTILRKFDYDAVVLVSLEYQHSILGINLPARGAYKIFEGKRYYTSELTAANMEIGQIDPEQGNMNLWKVYLASGG